MAIKLQLPPLIKAQLMIYAAEAKGEIGGLGRITIVEGNNFLLTEVFLIEQEAHSAECDLDSEGVYKLYAGLMGEGKDVDDIKCWWHSHGDIGVGFSTTDNTTISEWPKEAEWLIALVINKRGNLVAQLHTTVPVPLVAVLDVEDVMYHPNKDELIAEVGRKVREKKTEVIPFAGHQRYKPQYQTYNKHNSHVSSGTSKTLLEQLYPEVKDKTLSDLTQEEWAVLDEIIESLSVEDAKQIFDELEDNEETLSYIYDGVADEDEEEIDEIERRYSLWGHY